MSQWWRKANWTRGHQNRICKYTSPLLIPNPTIRYVVPYGRYNLMETMPLAMMKHLEEDVPPVFMILDTYDKDVKVISIWIHIAIYIGP